MKQPRENVTTFVLDNEGNLVETTLSVAIEGSPVGSVQYGPIRQCPITDAVMYQSEMVELDGMYYSPKGAELKTEAEARGKTGPYTVPPR